MTRPIYEPTPDRKDATLSYGVDQLLRRPISVPGVRWARAIWPGETLTDAGNNGTDLADGELVTNESSRFSVGDEGGLQISGLNCGIQIAVGVSLTNSMKQGLHTVWATWLDANSPIMAFDMSSWIKLTADQTIGSPNGGLTWIDFGTANSGASIEFYPRYTWSGGVGGGVTQIINHITAFVLSFGENV